VQHPRVTDGALASPSSSVEDASSQSEVSFITGVWFAKIDFSFYYGFAKKARLLIRISVFALQRLNFANNHY